ncbi:MAG: phage integrase N-terminal SAM-like domain-containing protein [Verrucomicrobia bacterium]|nr:phage integrase N-terminal SAM-like domain-containing protein [Verrucomicrobiota bacterium]
MNRDHAYKKSSPHAILKSFADDLKLLSIGARTEQAYYACVRQLSEFYGKSPDLITAEEIRQYCIHLKIYKKVARHPRLQQ